MLLQGEIVGVMQFFKRTNTFVFRYGEKISTFVLDLDQPVTEDQIGKGFTKVFSFWVLLWLKDIDCGFRNIYNLLQEGGEALILFPSWCSIYSAYDFLKESPRWKQYHEGVGNTYIF